MQVVDACAHLRLINVFGPLTLLTASRGQGRWSTRVSRTAFVRAGHGLSDRAAREISGNRKRLKIPATENAWGLVKAPTAGRCIEPNPHAKEITRATSRERGGW